EAGRSRERHSLGAGNALNDRGRAPKSLGLFAVADENGRMRTDLSEPGRLRGPRVQGPPAGAAPEPGAAVDGGNPVEKAVRLLRDGEGRGREDVFLDRVLEVPLAGGEEIPSPRRGVGAPREPFESRCEKGDGERPAREVEGELDRDFGAVVVGEQMHLLRREPVEKGRELFRLVGE